jgi:hypothetical protein
VAAPPVHGRGDKVKKQIDTADCCYSDSVVQLPLRIRLSPS